MYLETSQDIRNIAVVVCYVWLTFFVTWAIYYVIQILKIMSAVMNDMRERLAAVDRFVRNVTEKLEHTTSMLQVLVTGFEKVAQFVGDRKSTRKKRSGDEE